MVRSQIAEAFYNKLSGTSDAMSAGTYVGAPDEPSDRVLKDILPEYFFAKVDAYGCDLRENVTKHLTPQLLLESDIAITMTEEPYVPDFLKESKAVVWNIPNEASSQNIKEIYRRVKSLIVEMQESKLR